MGKVWRRAKSQETARTRDCSEHGQQLALVHLFRNDLKTMVRSAKGSIEVWSSKQNLVVFGRVQIRAWGRPRFKLHQNLTTCISTVNDVICKVGRHVW